MSKVSVNGPAIDINYVLDKLYFSATDEHDKGDKFERLVRKWLLTEPVHADRFDEVWRWMDWPERGNRADRGIDLVARERETGQFVAVQCKFYDPAHYLTKPDIDSFLSESGKHPFRARIVVSTTDKWNSAARAAIEDQQIPVSLIGLNDLVESTIDWSQFRFDTPEVLTTKGRKELRTYQRTVLQRVREGFQSNDRGQLIMACGTGKTFTSLRVAEDLVPLGGRVLFLVPSIALLNQSLKEWSAEAEHGLRTFAVCSDSKVGRTNEDASVVDLAIPATTDPKHLAERATASGGDPNRLTVVFATYQSIDVIAQAQKQHGLPGFDLVICDEAHRTTGVTLAGAAESAFTRVHDDAYLVAAKRLYMTATPRLYDDNSKAKAGQANAVIASMDDEATFGPEFYRMGFGQAVSEGWLSDYKVLVLTVDEGAVAATFQRDLASNSELNLPDVARIVGCWNALAKRMANTPDGALSFATDPDPMRTAVAFARDIKTSKRFAETFEEIAASYLDALRIAGQDISANPLEAHVQHVDGTMNMLQRGELMDWLKAPGKDGVNEARILSNAKCLSEGVDVPALDAVMFLNPRKSVVDVVQSVGRVMRRAPGKQYGYIILPIAIPAGMKPEDALADNERFRVVWEVLQALRAHDERFNATVNKIELNKAKPQQIDIFHIGGRTGDADDDGGASSPAASPAAPVAIQPTLQLEALDGWRDAIYAKLVEKVGSRRYWETWAKDVAEIVERHTTRLRATIANPATPDIQQRFEEFVTALRANLNDSITTDAAVDMLSQHLVTKPVFDALFPGYGFTDHNPVAKVMETMLTALEGTNLEAETEALTGFYESVRMRAAGIDNATGKQKVITELYEKFFRLAFPKSADALGIVYTPTEIVDFILRSVNDLLVTEFGTTISAEGVHVLDPFTGTGTFITRLLSSGLIQPEDLERKYRSELHANEITLLAYYIATANIEATYHDLTASFADEPGGGAADVPVDPSAREWVPFDGIVLADTFQMSEKDDTLDAFVFRTNSARAERQLSLPIEVIVGNPPYSVGQTSGNDNNANVRYATLDAKIEKTYAARSNATSKRTLYDAYVRAIRWASDRIGDSGIVGFVTNGGFIDANTADGLRKTLAEEFTSLYVYNLRGNARTAGEQRQRERGNVFGAGARTTVSIALLVKHPDHTGPATLRYRDIGDYLTQEDKLAIVDADRLATVDWQTITPNAAGDWINQRGDDFDTYPALSVKQPEPGLEPLFRVGVPGPVSSRDPWVYGFDRAAVASRMERSIAYYNEQVESAATRSTAPLDQKTLLSYVGADPKQLSWSRGLRQSAARLRRAAFHADAIVTAAYRPFTKQRLYAAEPMLEAPGQAVGLFPPGAGNRGFALTDAGSHYSFCLIATDCVPDFHLLDTSKFFTRYTYEPLEETSAQGEFNLSEASDAVVIDGYRRLDNITDATLAAYREWYSPDVTKDDIFAFVYGLLHSPDYRSRFAADLKRSLPRIPRIEGGDFPAFRDAGQRLLDLHIGYEEVEPYPLTITGGEPSGPGSADLSEWFRVEKLKFAGKRPNLDMSTIVYNNRITISGIPAEAHEYMLGSRSALEWILDRYQVKTDKPSGIVNDPNDYSREVGNPRYILDLIGKVTRVSVDTVGLVNSLPPLRVRQEQESL